MKFTLVLLVLVLVGMSYAVPQFGGMTDFMNPQKWQDKAQDAMSKMGDGANPENWKALIEETGEDWKKEMESVRPEQWKDTEEQMQSAMQQFMAAGMSDEQKKEALMKKFKDIRRQ